MRTPYRRSSALVVLKAHSVAADMPAWAGGCSRTPPIRSARSPTTITNFRLRPANKCFVAKRETLAADEVRASAGARSASASALEPSRSSSLRLRRCSSSKPGAGAQCFALSLRAEGNHGWAAPRMRRWRRRRRDPGRQLPGEGQGLEREPDDTAGLRDLHSRGSVAKG